MPKPTPTSPNISTSKPEPEARAKSKGGISSLLALVLSVAALLALGGCMAVDETGLYADEPLGADYLPVVTRTIQAWPKRVLVLPVAGAVEDQTRSFFEASFRPALQDKLRWILISYPGIDSTRADLPITEAQALARAREAKADAILFVKLGDQRIYPPLRLSASVFIQDVETQQTILSLNADYDVNNLAVVESARRYAKEHTPKTDSPERSRAILTNQRQYFSFTGYYTAKLIADSFLVPAKKVTRAQPVEGQDYSGKFASPPPDLGKSVSTDTAAPASAPAPAPAPSASMDTAPPVDSPANTARPGPTR